MSLLGNKCFNILIVFIVCLVYTETVTSNINGNSNINYNDIRDDDQLVGVQPERAITTRGILEMYSNWAITRPTYTFQQATEHLLNFGALLRIQILDIFGALVYDHYDDYSIGQTEALYRVYQETLERKYNIFDIVPSTFILSDMKPTTICRLIHRHVGTCLKESTRMCTTIIKHDNPNANTSLAPVLKITQRVYHNARIRRYYPNGFSLPAILKHLQAGTLKLTNGLLSGLLHNIQYDSFDDEIRTAERNVLILLTSKILHNDQHEVLMTQIQTQRYHTMGDLLKELLKLQKNVNNADNGKNFAILSEHVVREVEAINRNIEILGTVYENNTIDMKYLLNLVLPPDVVNDDITEAKDYLLQKINDYDIVGKYLKVQKYQQSGPDQLLMEMLGQMKDINFAVDLVTALHFHARFWHQSHMINNLKELLELFDAYENLRNVPKYSSLMTLMDRIRNTLWDSTDVTVEILCNNPRTCLRLGLETVAECVHINSETRNNIQKLLLTLHKSGASQVIDNCELPAIRPEITNEPSATQNPMKIVDLSSTKLPTVQTSMSTSSEEETDVMLIIDGDKEKITTVRPTTTKASTEWLTISSEDMTTEKIPKLTTEDGTETTKLHTTDFTDEQVTKQKTTEKAVVVPLIIELPKETESTEEQLSTELTTEKLATTKHTRLTPIIEIERASETTPIEQSTTKPTEKSTIEEEIAPATIRNDCHGLECISETSDESTSSSGSGDKDHSSSHPLAQTTQKFKLREVLTTTPINSYAVVVEHTTKKLLEEETTPSPKVAILIKKPKPYSVGSSEEDCSGEGCASRECSGEGCASNYDSEETRISCDDYDCDYEISGENSEEDCSGDDCSYEVEIFEENGGCKGDECLDLESPECTGENCIRAPPTAVTSIPDCENGDCHDLSKSSESTCNGDDCADLDEGEILVTTEKNDSPLRKPNGPLVRCGKRDPHHHKKLDKLKKIRKLNARRPVAEVPSAPSMDNININFNNGNSVNKLRSPKPIRPDPPAWLKIPRNPPLERPSSWNQTFPNLKRLRKIKKERIRHQLIGRDMKSAAIDRTNTDSNKNMNVNLVNIKRHLTGGLEDVSTPRYPVLQKVSPPNGGYKRVLTRISSGQALGKWDQKVYGNSTESLKFDLTSNKTLDLSASHGVTSMRMNPVVHHSRRSDGNIELVSKNSSEITPPQGGSGLYQAPQNNVTTSELESS